MKVILKNLILALLVIVANAFAESDTRIATGKQVYDKWCTPCHAPGVQDHYPGTVALQVKYNGTPPATLEERTDLTADMITIFVRKGVSIMPAFRKTEISADELQALIDYLRSPVKE